MAATIRLATDADIFLIDEHLYPHLHNNHAPSHTYIRMAIHAFDYFLAVADEGMQEDPLLIGAATLHIIMQSSAGPKGYIDDLVVDPSTRRKGIGRLLFQFLEHIALQHGATKIFFTCAPWREPGNKFHIAMEYQLRGAAVNEHGTNYYEKILAPKT